VHKFGERKIGAVTYCTTRSTLETTLNESETIHKAKGIENSFPQGILEKLNLMHGGQNYESDPLKGVMLGTTPLETATHIMICSAHITHPGSDAANHCPSVAAVVASINSDAVQFHGDVRLQPTSVALEWKNNRLRHPAQPRILGLDEMIQERFRVWCEKHPDKVPNVIFYRDGLGHNKENVIEEDMIVIARKMREFFNESKVELTYIVANEAVRMEPHGADVSSLSIRERTFATHLNPRRGYNYYTIEPTSDLIHQVRQMRLDVIDLKKLVSFPLPLEVTKLTTIID
jgi:hypothetical protein